jgi:hypothetical protein
MHCGRCSEALHDGATSGACPACGEDRLRHGRFLLLEPLADGARAIDLQEQEGVRLWEARRFVPEGVECVEELWVSNTASEAKVLEAMEPLEDLFAFHDTPRLPVSFVDELHDRVGLRAVEPGRRRWWRRLRPVVMAGMMLALVPIGLAASPPPPDYAELASAPPGMRPMLEAVRQDRGVQRCLRTYRARVRVRDESHPALLVVEGSPTASLRPEVWARSGDPELTSCVVAAARRIRFPSGAYTLSVPVGEEGP